MGEITDKQWELLLDLFPEEKRPKGGRPRVSSRQVLNGVLWVLKTGSQWAQLPQKYGAYVTVWRRFKEWDEAGMWEKIWLRLLPTFEKREEIEWMLAFLEGKFVPGRKGRE